MREGAANRVASVPSAVAARAGVPGVGTEIAEVPSARDVDLGVFDEQPQAVDQGRGNRPAGKRPAFLEPSDVEHGASASGLLQIAARRQVLEPGHASIVAVKARANGSL
jgi:hypothetical protein